MGAKERTVRAATPDLWSFSSLREIEACSRRWMLSRAESRKGRTSSTRRS